jgi:DNA modification methylase
MLKKREINPEDISILTHGAWFRGISAKLFKEYLVERIRSGENLTKRSSILGPKTTAKRFISTTYIGDTIRKAIRKAGFSWQPYVLRSYFDTQLMLAESKGHLLRDYRTLWMGQTIAHYGWATKAILSTFTPRTRAGCLLKS